jgi:hypothetical protein
MAGAPSDYCKIYVDASITASDLAEEISKRIGVRSPWNTVRSDNLELEVRENEDFLSTRRRQHQYDFVRYRYYIDIEPVPGGSRAAYVREVSALLMLLWQLGMPAVAACDFESELPKHELGEFWSPERGASKGTDP